MAFRARDSTIQEENMAKRQGRGVALNDLLRSLVEASSDFEGAVLVGLDGLLMAAAWPIEEQSDFDVGAVATRAYELSNRTTETLDRGELERLIMLGSNGNMVITRAGPHALCVVLLKPQAKVGIASYEASRISAEIAQVLE
jgi:predicted regulator of Ras-like GTPase activity (Roadblock/LC7/MglB family)